MRGRTWVTRSELHVDRIARAWLIRRFIDPKARFNFVGGKSYEPEHGEIHPGASLVTTCVRGVCFAQFAREAHCRPSSGECTKVAGRAPLAPMMHVPHA